MAEPSGENIRVSVRVRPINKREEETAEKVAWRIVDGGSILPNENNPRRNAENAFTFGDHPPHRPHRAALPCHACIYLPLNLSPRNPPLPIHPNLFALPPPGNLAQSTRPTCACEDVRHARITSPIHQWQGVGGSDQPHPHTRPSHSPLPHF